MLVLKALGSVSKSIITPRGGQHHGDLAVYRTKLTDR